MTSPIEYLHTFDLHIYVGFRSWPDDIEHYCEVTYPGQDEAHPITINYMHGYSLEAAIQRAGEDIKAYMRDPESWVEQRRKEQEG